ncbi:MAG: glycosyltransferase [Nanoarchaeota archaeon]|nr:glycosyltransferase [Nanoarchaeota archaeon]
MMISAQGMTLFIYNLAIVPVIFFSIIFLVIAFLNLFISPETRLPKLKKYPKISVQIPVYNDPIAAKCIRNCMKFDYPDFEIIIVDDSTDKKTSAALRIFSEKNPEIIKYIHRDNRAGFKPGALINAMSITKGEVVVLFDSDWRPEKDFLQKIVAPMQGDPNVAIVQARQGFCNDKTNLVSRFASYLLKIHHNLMMPIHSRANSVFFCGTAGAIRRSALEKIGGWNDKSITEDADLSVKLLSKGYKIVYINVPVASEVPTTIEGFVKQQMRWCYGLTRTFFDNFHEIFTSKKLSFMQRMMITYNTLGNMVSPVVILMTLSGTLGWFLGEPQLFKPADLVDFGLKFVYTSGFLMLGGIALARENQLEDFPYLVLGTFTVSLVLVTFNSVAFIKAVLNQPLHWHRTPKTGSSNGPN